MVGEMPNPKLIKLSDYDNNVQITVDEALETAKDYDMDSCMVLIIKDHKLTGWIQGGGLSCSDMLWYVEKLKNGLLNG